MSPQPHSAKDLAVSLGDPGGIGPEIAIKALVALSMESATWLDRLVLHGQIDSIRRTIDQCETSPFNGDVPNSAFKDRLRIVPVNANASASDLGKVSEANGECAYQSLMSALMSIRSGQAAGVVTAPLSKAALNLAGHLYPGHTELLAEFAGQVPVRMMLANDELAVVLVTIHVPLRDALNLITRQQVAETIRITAHHLARFGSARRHIAVAGLNPHAGEDGLLGREEQDIIAPAIADCVRDGIDVSGPYPPDTIFMRARLDRTLGAVVAQYHDQGLIPVKYLGVEHGVNITLGLPFVRTSPDHGTAFDIAGQGIADPRSMIAAIRKAAEMAGRSINDG